MNRTLVVAAIAIASTSCKSRDTEVTVTTTGTPTGSAGSADPTGSAEAPAKSTTRQRLEKSLRKRLADTGFDTFTCPDVGPSETETTCTVAAKNGAKVTSKVVRTKQNADGVWSSWETNLDSRVISAEELADKIRDGVTAEVKKAHPKATLDLACGTSPIVFVDHKAACKATLHNPDEVRELSIDDSKDDFVWTADAF